MERKTERRRRDEFIVSVCETIGGDRDGSRGGNHCSGGHRKSQGGHRKR